MLNEIKTAVYNKNVKGVNLVVLLDNALGKRFIPPLKGPEGLRHESSDHSAHLAQLVLDAFCIQPCVCNIHASRLGLILDGLPFDRNQQRLSG